MKSLSGVGEGEGVRIMNWSGRGDNESWLSCYVGWAIAPRDAFGPRGPRRPEGAPGAQISLNTHKS